MLYQTVFIILSSMFAVMFMAFAGWLSVRIKLFNDKGIGSLTNLIFFISIPCLIVYNMQVSFTKEMFYSSSYLVIFTIFNFAVGFFSAFVLSRILKLSKTRKGLFFFMCIFHNYSFLPLVLSDMLYGSQGVLYVIIYSFIGDILLWTSGIHLIDGKKIAFDPKTVLNPGFIALTAGSILVFAAIKLPGTLLRPINMLGNVTIPLAMFVSGAVLAAIKFKEIKKYLADRDLLMVVCVRLIIGPLAAILLLKQFSGIDPIVKSIIIIQSCMPPGFSTVIFARQYNKEPDFTSAAVFTASILAIITTPFYLYISGAISG